MARQSSKRPGAGEPDTELEPTTDTTLDEAAVEPQSAESEAVAPEAVAPEETSPEADAELEAEAKAEAELEADGVPAEPADRALWDEVRIDPVEIALPAGTGFTLRAYRLSTEVTPTDVSDRDEDDPFSARARDALTEEEEIIILDDQFADIQEEKAEDEAPRRGRRSSARAETDEDGDEVEPDEVDAAEAEAEEAEEEVEEEEEPPAEEVPMFLSHRGKLLLFKTPESLVSFVRSGAPHDLAQIDTWDEFAARVQPADIAPLDEDSYELDLVVENLRGGHDTWDPTLLIEAGEVARDVAYALRLTSVLDMLSTGSSLDDLDEALRSSARGGVGGFMGRRRLRKIGAQTASLGWRTIVGKISTVVDWRD